MISVPFNEEGGVSGAAHQLINSGFPTAAVTFNGDGRWHYAYSFHQRAAAFTFRNSSLLSAFDDVVLARYLYPALTTMHYPVEQMARCAAQLRYSYTHSRRRPAAIISMPNWCDPRLLPRALFFTMNARQQ